MKKMLILLLCGLLLAGCGQDDAANDASQNVEQSGVAEENVEDSELAQTDDLEEEYDEDFDEDYEEDLEEETAEDDGMMDFTVYTGDVVSVASDGLTRIALDAEQVIPVEQIEYVLSNGVTFYVPAASVQESFKDYDALVSNGTLELIKTERYRDYMQRTYISIPEADFFEAFFLDNESNEEVVDGINLPVTHKQISFENPITINGFTFNENTFVLADLVAAWGDPLFAHVDCIEGVLESVDYYWRYLDGYVTLTVEDDKPYMFHVHQWDTYAIEYEWIAEDIPRLEE